MSTGLVTHLQGVQGGKPWTALCLVLALGMGSDTILLDEEFSLVGKHNSSVMHETAKAEVRLVE